MDNVKKLTLLHSNDMHGDFLAEKVDEKLVGGVSMLSGYINKVRGEEENVLYCVAGDMFRGSVIDSEFQGLSTVEIMNMLSPDIMTVGNHEADYGLAHLLFVEKCASFPIINANLRLASGRRLFSPCRLIKINGMRVLFIGLITEDVLAETKKEGLIGSMLDVSEAADEVGRICGAYRDTDVDLTVLLTHIGFEEDKKLAARLDPAWGVDIIIGGHSHTVLSQPETVNGVLIAQAGTGTDKIGRFDIEVDTDNNRVKAWKWECVDICADTCPRDEKTESLLEGFKKQTDLKYDRVLTRFAGKLTHPERIRQTGLGGLFADILTDSLGIDMMLLASGSIRSESMGPVVTLRDLNECLPFDEKVNMLMVSGEQFRRMMKHMLRDEIWQGIHCEFYQLPSKVTIVYDRETHEFERFDIDGAPFEDDALYSIALQQYHIDNFTDIFALPLDVVEANARRRVIASSCRDVAEEYFISHSNIKYRPADVLEIK